MTDPRVQVAATDALALAAKLDAERWLSLVERAAVATLEAEAARDATLSVTLIDDAGIAELNRDWLAHEGPTDVISFPLHGPGEPPEGDVYVGFEQAVRQAAELGVALEEELARLVVHGTLHVLGYDHPEGAEREESDMWGAQEAIVRGVLARGGGARGEDRGS